MKKLILPGDPLFDATLASPPPNWRETASQLGGEFAFVARSGSGLLEPVSPAELDEYLEGGEYEQRLLESDQHEEYLEAFGGEGALDEYLVFNGDDCPPA